jgi:hypothetical protein
MAGRRGLEEEKGRKGSLLEGVQVEDLEIWRAVAAYGKL